MRTAILLVLPFLLGCSYTTTDDGRVAELANRVAALEARQSSEETRANIQGEQIQSLNRRLLK